MADYKDCENAFLNGYAAAKNEYESAKSKAYILDTHEDIEMVQIKDKDHKPPMHMILWKPVRWLIKIRLYGLEKYKDAEHYKVVPEVDWYDACMRHLCKWAEGERIDPESGLPHTAHALCNLFYLIELTEKEAEF